MKREGPVGSTHREEIDGTRGGGLHRVQKKKIDGRGLRFLLQPDLNEKKKMREGKTKKKPQ